MKDKNKKQKIVTENKSENDFIEEYLDYNKVVSANETTGLIPSWLVDKEEAESFSEEFKINKQKRTHVTRDHI